MRPQTHTHTHTEDEDDALLFGSDEDEGQGFAEDLSMSSNRSKKKAGKKVRGGLRRLAKNAYCKECSLYFLSCNNCCGS